MIIIIAITIITIIITYSIVKLFSLTRPDRQGREPQRAERKGHTVL